MSWARIQFDRKQVNVVLRRCKNGAHQKNKRVSRRDEKLLNDTKYLTKM